jgi:hypothetical protein
VPRRSSTGHDAQTIAPSSAASLLVGETLYVNVCYVDFSANGRPQGTLSHADNPDEYAELILATFERLRDDGVTPDAFEYVLEPENTAWDGTKMGRAAVTLKARFGAAGFSPEYIGPSTTSATNTVPYYDDFIAVPGASDILDMLSYHLYRGSNQSSNRQAILAAAQAHGLQTGMLEFTDGTVDHLYPDLTEANVSAWEKYAGSSPASSRDRASTPIFTSRTVRRRGSRSRGTAPSSLPTFVRREWAPRASPRPTTPATSIRSRSSIGTAATRSSCARGRRRR